MAYVYILKSINHPKTYTGSTDRTIEARLAEHNNGFSTYTKRFAPWKLIYSEEFENLLDARLREQYLKSAAGRRFIKKNNIVRE